MVVAAVAWEQLMPHIPAAEIAGNQLIASYGAEHSPVMHAGWTATRTNKITWNAAERLMSGMVSVGTVSRVLRVRISLR